jgi:hypothetical protein
MVQVEIWPVKEPCISTLYLLVKDTILWPPPSFGGGPSKYKEKEKEWFLPTREQAIEGALCHVRHH